MSTVRVMAASMLVLALGCGSEGGKPTQSTCPQPQTLTYANFGQSFMATYCLRCHSSTRTGAARFGAPVGVDFDTQANVQSRIALIDENAAAGPAATNTAMPPGAPLPTSNERTQLGQWLACGAP